MTDDPIRRGDTHRVLGVEGKQARGLLGGAPLDGIRGPAGRGRADAVDGTDLS